MENESPREDWARDAEARLDEAERSGDEARLQALEEMNERLEAELDLDRPRRPEGGEGAGAGGEAEPPGR